MVAKPEHESAWARACRESPRIYTSRWEFAVSSALVTAGSIVAALAFIDHSHTSDGTLTVGAIAIAVAGSLLLVFLFQFCAAPVRQRNAFAAELDVMKQRLTAAQQQLTAAQHELELLKTDRVAALQMQLSDAEVQKRERTRSQLYAIRERIGQMRLWTDEAVSYGDAWQGQGWTRPTSALLTAERVFDDVALGPGGYPVFEACTRVFRLANSVRGIADGMASADFTPPMDPLIELSLLDEEIASALPLLDAAIEETDAGTDTPSVSGP